jgi:hypothetical protein
MNKAPNFWYISMHLGSGLAVFSVALTDASLAAYLRASRILKTA